MTDINILQQRLDRAKAAIREAKKRDRVREQQRIFDAVRRSGLSLADLENLLANRAASTPVPSPVSEPIPEPVFDLDTYQPPHDGDDVFRLGDD